MGKVRNFIEHLRHYTELSGQIGKSGLGLALDVLYYRVFCGYNPEQYFRNEFYNFKREKCLTFLSIKNWKLLQQKCCDQEKRPLVDYKPLFNKNFSQFLKRDWVDMESCSKEDFLSFAEKHPESFCKVSDGLQGIGAEQLDFRTQPAEAFWDEHKGEKIILEELIQQHHEMAEFNPSTVNTLRVVTFVCEDGTVKLLGAALRTGRAGQIADNFHHHGIASTIDVDTGIVICTGIDNQFVRYVKHPDSGKAFPGFKIPHWDLVVEEVKKAALVVPEAHYIGWDIAVREDDICFVEGNTNAAVDVIEMPLKEGMWAKIKPYAMPFLNKR